MTGAEIPVAMAIAGAEAGTAMGATAASMLPAVTAGTLGATGAGMLGAGMGAGAGMGGTAASMFGAAPEVAASTAGILAPEAAAPVAGMGGGTAGLFGAAGADASPLAIQMASGQAIPGQSIPWASIMKGAGQGMQAMGNQKSPQPAPAQRPQQTMQPMSNAEVLRRMAELRQLPGRSNFAGLLGRFQ